MKRISLIVFLFLSLSGSAFSFRSVNYLSPTDYIEEFKDAAIKEMQRYSIPASITMGQAILESNYGNSNLAKNANNHFGIKCHKEWTGATYTMDDDESDECFRKYENVIESYVDHSLFLTTRIRYSALFQLSKKDYKAWAKGLKEAGYATHPKYAEMLIETIEKYKLYELDDAYMNPSYHFAYEKENKSSDEAKLNFDLKYFFNSNQNTVAAAPSTKAFLSVIKQFDKSTQEYLKINMLYLDEEHCLSEKPHEEIVVDNKVQETIFLGTGEEIQNVARFRKSTLKNDLVESSHLEMDYPHFRALIFPDQENEIK